MNKHKHHIIPRYKCKELGIDPDFPENIVEVAREDHALIHWGYWCDDLEPLFKYVTPSQEIIDMIPLGDKRDMWAAQINAMGEIDGIDMSGENHPMYGRIGKDNPLYGIPRSEETKKKISEALKGKPSPLKGIPRSESIKNIEYEEFMEKISGDNHWSHGLKPGEHPMCGIPRSKETKKKLSEAHTGKTVLEETKEKLRIARQKQLNDEEYLKKYREGVKKAGLLRRGRKQGPMSEETKKKVSIAKKKFYEDNPNIASTWSKRGEEHQSYAHGRAVNARNDPEVMRAYKAEYYQKNKKKKTREQKDAINKKRREKRAKNKAETGFAMGYSQAKKKTETQGVGTLEDFLK